MTFELLLKSNISLQSQYMECHCNSKTLYKRQYTHPQETFSVGGKTIPKKRLINDAMVSSSHPHLQIEQKIAQTAQLWLPTEIQRISWDQVTFNPLWFNKKYLSKNVPCIITDVLQGDDIFQRWAEPQYFCQVLQGQTQSVSLTPDGFADSIQGNYFVEPHQQKCPISHFFDHKQRFPNAVPYIQHQNGNLTNQFSTLNCQVSQQIVRNISEYFFKGADPQAQNIWIGHNESVSSLHKDPYQNFYLPIVGEKHFTLLPPISILYLEEQEYDLAKWKYSNHGGEGKFSCEQGEGKSKWICVNPDLKEDQQRFTRLKSCQAYHVTVKKEQMLYLPSLWYHQVSQVKGKDPYALAINYWFDMEFTHNFSLYETCRALRNLN